MCLKIYICYFYTRSYILQALREYNILLYYINRIQYFYVVTIYFITIGYDKKNSSKLNFLFINFTLINSFRREGGYA